MKRSDILIPACVLFLLAGCNARQDSAGSYAPADHSNNEISTDSASVADAPINSPDRKIIRTADLRCRVKDVFATTSGIENLVTSLGGQVSKSTLENSIDDTRRLQYASDSLQVVQSYTTTAQLTLRVPFERLDTLLTVIASNSAFMNERHLKLEDVTLQYLGNQLRNKAQEQNNVVGQVSKGKRKISQIIDAGQYIDQRNDQRIDRTIENFSLNTQARFATLTLDLYQPQRLDRQIIADTDKMMQPGFGQRTKMALMGGWQMIQELMLLLLRIWPLVLAGLIVMIVFRKKLIRLAPAAKR